MEFTGIAGQILGWVIMITAYTIILLGIINIWAWIFDRLFKKTMLYFKAWGTIIEFLFDKQKYKRKLKDIEDHLLTP